MIIKQRLPLGIIVRRTWHESLWIALACAAAYGIEYLLADHFALPTMIPPLLGTALAFFIGFSNSQAYDRWWEARTIWGAIVNESRSWARGCISYIREDGEHRMIERLVLRHIAFVYALKGALRGTSTEQSGDEYRAYLSEAEFDQLQRKQNKHNALLDLQSRDLDALYATNRIDGFKFMELNRRITTLCEEMGKCERIRNTVFPPTYNYYTRMFVWVFIVSTTIVMVNAVGTLGVFIGFLLGYVFLVSHGIGTTLLNPFEQVIAGTPLDQISRNIEINLLEMLGKDGLPEPVHSIKNVYVT
ncbi:Bestrophin, RFP-TM, chloride channel [Mycobacteroides abscessus subsp. abscessus]|nr:hypothetical protein BST18_05945 [Mycobacteroides abscessus subsp. bolletii]TPF65564.1 membrane protein [Mycobacteroides abscessus subsp. bolletii]BBB40407.1 hypothetical protein MASB_09730 [Mycobacteroides abscessus subsp. bolletii BD]SKS03281.1 Bestrophin, RFP-TM, chloride channel [Mycobacteroides abscessus subsp. abscessus]